MSYYDRSPTRSSRNNDTSFRGLDIEDIHAGKAIQWDFSDKIIFYRHMARYQITGRENVNRGLSELERDLGIQDRSTWYKQPILEKATASILYNLNQHCKGRDDSEARLKRTEMQNRYVINIIRSIVPWKREMDDWRSGQDRTKVESLNVPEHVPILRSAASQYTADSHSEMQMFPDIPASVAAFNPRKGRLLSP
ncbi:hypothetical protein ACHAO9_012348 [Fusarium lateritium]